MEREGRIRTELHYYSDRLKRKLDEMRFARATVIEAPSGYGKTTAARDYLESKALEGTPVHWFTAIDEQPSSGFRRLCREIAKVDDEAGQRLLRIELPNAVTIGEACDALRSIKCRHETYLVVDNYQLLHDALPPSFFLALIEHGGDALRVIVMTQMLTRGMLSAAAGRGFLRITASDLRLSAGDIRRYYALAGVEISPEKAKELERYTEGWIIAVYLQLCAYREAGTFTDTEGIMSLLEHLVWGALTEEQQTFLLRLSPFEMFTVRQACSLLARDTLPEYTQTSLLSPFIRFGRTEGCYEMHSILSKLLVQKRKERGIAFDRECLRRAGDWCRDDGRTAEALGHYWQTKDYESMLSLDLSHMMLEEIGDTPFSQIALDIARNCPAEVRSRNVLSMLRIAWALLMAGMFGPFDSLMEELGTTLGSTLNSRDPEMDGGAARVAVHHAFSDDSKAQAPDDISPLLGEWTLLSSFREYPDLSNMTETLRVAASLLRGQQSRVVLPSAPWWFGSHSVLATFHMRAGEADREADELEAYIALYSKLTNGHGCGADSLFRAELAYQRGDLSAAEVHAYKASFLAESRQQSIVQLGAAMILGQIALQKADTGGWQHAVNSMERAASYPLQNTFVVRSALDAVRGVLLTELQDHEGLAKWLQSGDFSSRLLLAPMMANALFVHAMYLMLKGEAARLIGIIEARQPEAPAPGPFSEIIWLLILSAGYIQIGDRARATQMIERAAEVGAPDGIISPLMSFSWILQGIPDELVKRKHPHLLDKYNSLKKRFHRGWQTLRGSMFPDELPEDLTPREREVAELAAKGLHNSEIAERLVVSQATVRAHLRAIFQKLDIDRRARLAEKLK